MAHPEHMTMEASTFLALLPTSGASPYGENNCALKIGLLKGSLLIRPPTVTIDLLVSHITNRLKMPNICSTISSLYATCATARVTTKNLFLDVA